MEPQMTKEQLREMEEKEKTWLEKRLDVVFLLFPLACGLFAIWEYWEIPNLRKNKDPMTYVSFSCTVFWERRSGWWTSSATWHRYTACCFWCCRFTIT